MTIDLVAGKAWIGVAVFAVLFIAERLAPAAPAPGGIARLVRNGILWALLFVLSPAIVLPLSAFAAAHPLWTRPSSMQGLASLAADIVVLDLWAYLVHRAYHEARPMWRLHRVHHLDEHLDTTSAVRFHPVEVAFSAALRMAPIVLVAIPFAHVVIFESALLAASLFHHSNVRLPAAFERALSRIIVTPSIHWVHHHAVFGDTNSNYSAIFSLWDSIFRTRSETERSPAMKIGLPNLADKSAAALLLAPFQRMEKQ